jgi:predicted NUDIX family NTP pyrophosphohydrolase
MAGPVSAGLLMFSAQPESLRVLLAHPGGPYFARKDLGCWTIPKGLAEPAEDLLQAARREFAEETGLLPGDGPFLPLGHVVQKYGKTVHAWAFAGRWPRGRPPESNTFPLEWPPRSGRIQHFAEVDRVEMFTLLEARRKMNPRQVPFLDRLLESLSEERP